MKILIYYVFKWEIRNIPNGYIITVYISLNIEMLWLFSNKDFSSFICKENSKILFVIIISDKQGYFYWN